MRSRDAPPHPNRYPDCLQQPAQPNHRRQAFSGSVHRQAIGQGEATPSGTGWLQISFATRVCRLRHDQMARGPTGPHAGCSTFLLSFGGGGGGYY